MIMFFLGGGDFLEIPDFWSFLGQFFTKILNFESFFIIFFLVGYSASRSIQKRQFRGKKKDAFGDPILEMKLLFCASLILRNIKDFREKISTWALAIIISNHFFDLFFGRKHLFEISQNRYLSPSKSKKQERNFGWTFPHKTWSWSCGRGGDGGFFVKFFVDNGSLLGPSFTIFFIFESFFVILFLVGYRTSRSIQKRWFRGRIRDILGPNFGNKAFWGTSLELPNIDVYIGENWHLGALTIFCFKLLFLISFLVGKTSSRSVKIGTFRLPSRKNKKGILVTLPPPKKTWSYMIMFIFGGGDIPPVGPTLIPNHF